MEHFSSVSKGETLDDTVRSVYQTTGADAIVLRHPDDDSSEVASKISSVPIINAGSGTREHPTQALLDLYTIYSRLGTIDNLHLVMVGDLKYGRTIKSLVKLMTKVGTGNTFTFVSPQELMAPKELVDSLNTDKVVVTEKHAFGDVLSSADVVYMTRVQKEWFVAEGKLADYEHLKNAFILDGSLVATMPEKAIVMHPLPRVGEILHEVDADPRASYFPQMRSGLYVRMALLLSILGK
jgi:aspartate carbamoyltransferase